MNRSSTGNECDALNHRFISSIGDVSKDEWNALCDDYPFLKYEFLSALETSGALSEESGWQAHHLVVYEHGAEGETLVAGFPCYLKSHSYGEYVFDHSWANAYYQNGLEYYPKLTLGIPFTPITGPRFVYQSQRCPKALFCYLATILNHFCEENNLSSWHCLFADQSIQNAVKEHSFDQDVLERSAVHFRWQNRGYSTFDDFLAEFSSRKRKNLKKERQALVNEGIQFKAVEGKDLNENDWAHFYHLYQLTYAKKSGHGGYLPKTFFTQIAQSMPSSLVLVLAYRDDQVIAGALNFKDGNNLYGRYWGCFEDVKHLHFETCYYQGIDYAIREGLDYFDPGVQGEHKIQRGFEPRYTYSYHGITRPDFRAAIATFLDEEQVYLEKYLQETRSLLPFKQQN